MPIPIPASAATSDLHARIAALEAENAALTARLRSSQAATVAGQAVRDEADAQDRARTTAAAADRLALGASEQANAALRRANAALTESRAARHTGEQHLRQILESATDFAIITIGLDGRVSGWNAGARNILGWQEEEILGQPAALIWTSEDLATGAAETEMRVAREQGRHADERWHLRRDGSRFWASGLMTPMRDEDGSLLGYLKILRDRTDRRGMEEALRDSESRFRRLAESIPHFVFRARNSGARVWGSPQWTAFTGLSEKQSLGQGWLDAIHPDDRPATLAAWAAAAASGLFSVEHRTRHAADGTYRWFQSRAVPVVGKSGRVAEWFGTSTDIHDQILAREVLARGASELEALVAERTLDLAHALDALRTEVAERSRAEEILRQVQKMEAVGQLTGGIAHDFNNMLQGIGGGLHMARQRLLQGRQDEILPYLDLARDAVDRAAGLTRRLLAFARQQTLDPKPVNPGVLVAGMVDLVRRTVGPEITVGLELCDSARDVICDPNELENALLNLCINARDAMPQGGQLAIGTEKLVLAAADLAGQAEVTPGEYVVIRVTDNGEGIPPDVIERVFEPFFSTKPLGQGTGLGLSQVYGFVRQSGGFVRLQSTPGQGTTIRLYLPRQNGVARAVAPPDVMAMQRTAHGETLLLVDDEPDVRGPAAERLRELGYTVLEAADGPALLQMMRQAPEPKLLITDVGLPEGMNGRQVAEAVRRQVPELPVLFITGYAGVALPPGAEVLNKPFELDTLARRVQALLAREP
jgi:PAS domain S-box-containing protein